MSRKRQRSGGETAGCGVAKKRPCLELTRVEDVEDMAQLADRCGLLVKRIVGQSFALVDELKMLCQLFNKVGSADMLEKVTQAELHKLLGLMCHMVQTPSANKHEHRLAALICLNVFANPKVPPTVCEDKNMEEILVYLKVTMQQLGSSKSSFSQQEFEAWSVKSLRLVAAMMVNRRTRVPVFFDLVGESVKQLFAKKHSPAMLDTLKEFMVTVFRAVEETRVFITSSVVGQITKLPETSSISRISVNTNLNLSVLTVLSTSLIQAVAPPLEAPSWQASNTIITVAGFFVVSMLRGCTQKHKTGRDFVELWVSELLQLTNLLDWPGANVFIRLIQKPMAFAILSNKDPAFKAFAVKILYKIAFQLRKNDLASQTTLAEIMKKVGGNVKMSVEDVLQSLVLQHVKDGPARNMYVAMLAYEEQENKYMDKWRNPDWWKKVPRIKLSAEQEAAVVHGLSMSRYKFSIYSLVQYIIKAIVDPNKRVMSMGAQCLANLISLDSDLLGIPIVSKAFNVCLEGSSAAARDSMCTLIGSFLLGHMDKALAYIPYLLRMLSDTSVLVKKTCIKTVASLIRCQPELPNKGELLYRVLILLQDEEQTVQKQAEDLCFALWFGEGCAQHIDALLEVAGKANSMICLRHLLEDKLKPTFVAIMENTQSQVETQVVDSCQLLVAILIDCISHDTKALPSLKILHIFALVYPAVLERHIQQLAMPLLSDSYTDNQDKETITSYIMSHVLDNLKHFDIEFLITLQDALAKKLTGDVSLTFTAKLTVGLINLLDRLSSIDRADTLSKWFQTNLNILQMARKDDKQVDANTGEGMVRAIRVVCFLKGGYETAWDTIRFFLNHPRYILATLQALKYVISDHHTMVGNCDLQIVLFKCLKDRTHTILTQLALEVVFFAIKNVKDPLGDKNINVMREADSEVTSQLVQTCLKDLLECTTEAADEVRRTACIVVTHIFRQGLVMENRLVPHFICMTTDTNPNISATATDLLGKIKEKRTWNLFKSCQKGILLSHALHQNLTSTTYRTCARGFVQADRLVRARLDGLYRLVQEDTTCRRQVMDAVLGELKPEANTSALTKLYLLDNMATITFKYQDDVLYLLQQIAHFNAMLTLPEITWGDEETVVTFIDKFYAYYLFPTVVSYLQKRYGVTYQKLQSFDNLQQSKDPVHKGANAKYKVPVTYMPCFKDFSRYAKQMMAVLKTIEKIESSQSSSSTMEPIKRKPQETPQLLIKLKKIDCSQCCSSTMEPAKRKPQATPQSRKKQTPSGKGKDDPEIQNASKTPTGKKNITDINSKNKAVGKKELVTTNEKARSNEKTTPIDAAQTIRKIRTRSQRKGPLNTSTKRTNPKDNKSTPKGRLKKIPRKLFKGQDDVNNNTQ